MPESTTTTNRPSFGTTGSITPFNGFSHSQHEFPISSAISSEVCDALSTIPSTATFAEQQQKPIFIFGSAAQSTSNTITNTIVTTKLNNYSSIKARKLVRENEINQLMQRMTKQTSDFEAKVNLSRLNQMSSSTSTPTQFSQFQLNTDFNSTPSQSTNPHSLFPSNQNQQNTSSDFNFRFGIQQNEDSQQNQSVKFFNSNYQPQQTPYN